SREQAVPRVRAAHAAGPFAAVQSQRVRAEIVAPEGGVEAPAQLLRLLLQPSPQRLVAEPRGEAAGPQLGRVDVSLHLAQGHGPLCGAAVRVEDRVVGILPALLLEPRLRPARVFDEAVPVPIAVTIDPVQGPLDRRPELDDRL